MKLFRKKIKPGDVYEDCAYHPIFCISADYHNDDLVGYSLFNGLQRSCSPKHCAPRLLTPEQVEFKMKHRDKWLAAEKAFHALTSYAKIPSDSPYHKLLEEEYKRS